MALKNIGSLWIARSGSKAAFTGYMDGPNRTKGPKILVFPNEKATPENRQPQFRIVQDDGAEAKSDVTTTWNSGRADGSDEETPF
jgi:hypothetical protein